MVSIDFNNGCFAIQTSEHKLKELDHLFHVSVQPQKGLSARNGSVPDTSRKPGFGMSVPRSGSTVSVVSSSYIVAHHGTKTQLRDLTTDVTEVGVEVMNWLTCRNLNVRGKLASRCVLGFILSEYVISNSQP